MEVVKPLGLSTVGLVMRFSVARNYGGLATALAQPANSGVSNGGIAKPQWQSGWGWAGVSLGYSRCRTRLQCPDCRQRWWCQGASDYDRTASS
jgi:hypothetical protein